jgi:hypothetical protein
LALHELIGQSKSIVLKKFSLYNEGGDIMAYKIYIHRNKINGKVYIGQTSEDDINRRFKGGSGYKSSPHFYYAIE